MIINAPEHWWFVAIHTLPHLKEYATRFGVTFDSDAAKAELAAKNHEALVRRLNQLWADLPNTPSIRVHPFHYLSDLCSEYHVFGNTKVYDEIMDKAIKETQSNYPKPVN
jgi:hypothetical protein